MNNKQYLEFQKAIAFFQMKNNVRPGCHSPNGEESFSWLKCDCCGSKLACTRENLTFITNDGGEFGAEICSDCVYFLEYGCLDDRQMMEMAH